MSQFLRLIFIAKYSTHCIFKYYTHCHRTISTWSYYYGYRRNLDQVYYLPKTKQRIFFVLTKRIILKAKEKINYLLGLFDSLPQTRITETTDIL